MSFYFSNGFERIFGTFPLKDKALSDAVAIAVDVGYRAFDTAQMYQNEAATGKALRDTAVPREQLCITTKVQHPNFAAERFLPSVEQSLRDLQTDYVDVLLLHWPPEDGNVVPSLELLAEAQHKGYTRNVGISNYTIAMMKTAIDTLEIPIATNQVEFHPLLDQQRVLNAADELGIPLTSYCSVARGEIFKYKELQKIGSDYSKSAAQVAQRWILQKGVAVNTMSTNPENIKANFEIMDFTLSDQDMARIDSLGKQSYRIVNKELVPWAPEFD